MRFKGQVGLVIALVGGLRVDLPESPVEIFLQLLPQFFEDFVSRELVVCFPDSHRLQIPHHKIDFIFLLGRYFFHEIEKGFFGLSPVSLGYLFPRPLF